MILGRLRMRVLRRMREVVGRVHGRGARVIGATVVSAVGSANTTAASNQKRLAQNEFIRNSGVFDAVADFDGATVDKESGGLRAEFVPDSTTGGPGERLHPNRADYLAMAGAVDLKAVVVGVLALGR